MILGGNKIFIIRLIEELGHISSNENINEATLLKKINEIHSKCQTFFHVAVAFHNHDISRLAIINEMEGSSSVHNYTAYFTYWTAERLQIHGNQLYTVYAGYI